MGKSTLVMLFLLAFGPNKGEPVSRQEAPPPAIEAEALSTRAAPGHLTERYEAPARALLHSPAGRNRPGTIETGPRGERPEYEKENG